MSHPIDRSLRVLVAHNAYQQRGGEDSVVEAEVALLRAHGHAVELYLRHNDELQGVGPLTAAKTALWSSRTAADLAAILARFKPDVVHAHNTFAVISPSLFGAASRAQVPVVQTLHNFRLLCLNATFLRQGRVCEDCLGRFPWRGVVHRCYHGSAPASAALATLIGVHRALGTYQSEVSRYIALSDFSRTKLIAGGLPGERIVVKPNFVDLPAPVPGRARTGGLFVGRLSPEKGVGVLARAAAARPDTVIDVVGAGPERESLEGRPGFRLLGWQVPETIHARMREVAYLVAPSICFENCPVAVIEAFACGLPVIASRLGGLAEMVKDGETGLLFEPDNPDDLAQKLAWADAHPEAMAAFGHAARREYQLRYTPERNYEMLMRVYGEAMGTIAEPVAARATLRPLPRPRLETTS
jgi:glycosyltransferase involved in cell wall biosynthesis